MVDCPTKSDLERLLREELGDPDLARVLAHVEDCTICQDTLHELSASDSGAEPLSFQSVLAEISAPGPTAEAEAFLDRLEKKARPERDRKPEIEGYEILEEIGRGAAGVVYRARHSKLNRLVALKTIVAGRHLSSEARSRFQREAQAIARLKHPNIVQIYDVGEQAGDPYLVLELVEGATLSRALGGLPRPAPEAAKITMTLAKAIEYAHHQGVIHRDLKPANILLRIEAAPGRDPDKLVNWDLEPASIKVTDFGLAKLLSTSEFVDDQMTQAGAIMGTPAYVAPEQARRATDAGPAADVYSIGVILYELLTGRPPFQGPTPMETLLQAAHQEPVRPARLVHNVPLDLQTICLKCLEKSPLKRYSTAADLAADLGRFLNNEPIHARPMSWAEHFVRWVRRHKGVSAALAAVALLLMLIVVGSLTAAAHFRELEQQQRILTGEKGRLLDEKERERSKAVRAELREGELRQAAEKQGEELRRNLYFARMNLVGQAVASPSGIGRGSELLSSWEPMIWEENRPDLRHWEWYYLNGLCHRDRRTLFGHFDDALEVVWRCDSERLASAGLDGTVRIWDPSTGTELRCLTIGNQPVMSVAWSPDRARLASASQGGTVTISSAESGEKILSVALHAGEVSSVAWSPDGKRLASGGADQTVQIWDAQTGASQHVLAEHKQHVSSVAWSPDGRRLASASLDSTVRIWDTETGQSRQVLAGHVNWVKQVVWSPDGLRLASASNDQTVKIWNADEGQELLALRGHSDAVLSVAWSPDGSQLVTSSGDQTLKVWRAADGHEQFTLRGHTGNPVSVAWSPDGKFLASAGQDATIKIWNAAAGPETPVLGGHEGEIDSVAWSSDGQRLASGGADGTVQIRDLGYGTPQLVLHAHKDWARSASWELNGKRLASAGSDQMLRVWDGSTGETLSTCAGHGGEVFSLAWSPDGERLASGSADQTVRIWNAATGEQTQCLRGHEQWVRSVAWSPDGTQLASASWDRTVKIWDVTVGQEIRSLTGHTHEVTCVAWSPDGRWLASASTDQTIRIWDASTGAPNRILRGHTARVNSIVWSADGMRLASASWDQTVKIWDTSTGKETLTLDGHQARVNTVAWSPNGMALVSAGSDGTILVHDATVGYLAARAPQCLPVLDRRLEADSQSRADWRIRAEIHARQLRWDDAAADIRQSLSVDPSQRWFVIGPWMAGPYAEGPTGGDSPDGRFRLGQWSADEVEQGRSPGVMTFRPVLLTTSGFINLGALYNHAEHISCLVIQRVYSPEIQEVAILLGSDDQVRLWHDGSLIHEYTEARKATPEEDAVAVTLKAGWNSFVARVTNSSGDHALYLRLSDAPADLVRARAPAVP